MPNAIATSEHLAQWLLRTREHVLLFLDPTGVVIDVAGSVGPTLGYLPEQLIGRSLSSVFTDEDLALGLDRHELSTAATAGHAEDDRWHVRGDGGRIWVSGSLTALHDPTGRLVGFVKVIRDRTDLRTRIVQLEQRAQALDQANERKDVFIATLGHELRNPLAPLGNAAALLRRALGDEERTRFPLQIIDRQLALLRRLVDDLLDMTRIETGKLELRFEPLSLQDALRHAAGTARPAAQAGGLSLVEVVPDVPITIEADPARFEQMVGNLLNNAIKFTPAGGHVWLKATVESNYAVIRVEDSGIGIAPGTLPRIFELFTQEPGARRAGGLGIGLALVKNLAELHGGNVEARSDGRDRGSQFTLRLPLRQSALH